MSCTQASQLASAKDGTNVLSESSSFWRHGEALVDPGIPPTLCGSAAYPVPSDAPGWRPFFCRRALWSLTQLQDIHRIEQPLDEMNPEEVLG